MLRRTSILLTTLFALLLAGCGESAKLRNNVVVVLVDQLRKDSSDRWMEATNQLATEGVVIENMRAAAPWTYPSVISMMSGLYPQQHGANGHLTDNTLSTFDPDLPLLPGILRSNGYRTAAFVTNPFLHTFNPFHQGFDMYDISFINSQGNLRGLGPIVWKPEAMYSNRVNESIVEHFDAEPYDQAEFTYVHYIDVHGPWDHAPFSPDYESSIRYVDERIVELHEYFTERYGGDLLFFVTSDHGKALGDDEHVGEGFPRRRNKLSVHDFNLKIPFLILPSRQIAESRRVLDTCCNIDFTPTILDWLQIESALPLPGISLYPSIRGEGSPQAPARTLYANVSAFEARSDCLIYGDKKFVRYFDIVGGSEKSKTTFDLKADPRETKPIENGFGKIEPLLERVAGPQGVQFEGKFEEPDATVLDRLRKLGYMLPRKKPAEKEKVSHPEEERDKEDT